MIQPIQSKEDQELVFRVDEVRLMYKTLDQVGRKEFFTTYIRIIMMREGLHRYSVSKAGEHKCRIGNARLFIKIKL